MDGSLQIDRHHDMKAPKATSPCTASVDLEARDKLDQCSRRSPAARPLSLDAASSIDANIIRTTTQSQDWPHVSQASSLQQSLSSLDKPTTAHDADLDVARGSGMIEQSGISRLQAPNRKKPSLDLPDAHHMPNLDALGRRRSRSIGFGLRDSRIAALSVQLRTRLSHAAAKIEKKRHSQTQNQLPIGLLQSSNSTPLLSMKTLSQAGRPLSTGAYGDQQFARTSSLTGTTLSVPDAAATADPHPPKARMQPSLVSTTTDLCSRPQRDLQNNFRRSSSEQASPLRLGPAADTGSSRLNGQRRRPNPNPNPNLSGLSSRYEPFSRHGRHHSQHEFHADSDGDRVPETPPLRHSTLSSISHYNGASEHSQSSSMEQDAIETLLFMSSPGTSGYHTNSQNSQRNQDIRSIDNSVSQTSQLEYIDDSQTSGQSNFSRTRTTQAEDEIDKLLDQMNSDSDDDAN